MSMVKAIGFVSLFSASLVIGALPPFWDSVREIEGLLKDPALKDHFDSADVILSIERAPGGLMISTETRDVWVRVSTKPLDQPGPAQYVYHFDEVKPCAAQSSKKMPKN